MVGGGGGLQDFSVSPRPLGFGFLGFGLRGLRPGLDNLWLYIKANLGDPSDLVDLEECEE